MENPTLQILTTPKATAKRRVTFSALHPVEDELILNSTSPSRRQQVIDEQSDERPSFQRLRDQQVKEMCAGKRLPKTHYSKLEPWPEASLKLQQKWNNRSGAFKTFSERYMVSQTALLFLAEVEANDRFETFEKYCYLRQLAPTTAETYWTTWLSIQKALAMTPTEADQRITRIMKARSVAYPVQFPTPASTSDIQQLVAQFSESHPSLTAIVVFAFLTGQRISDMVQLGVADLKVDKHNLAITVRRGKTFTTAKPYTLWLPLDAYPCQQLIETARRSEKIGRLFLFSETNSDDERHRILHAIHLMMISVNEALELRSIRRGGLHLMAQNGHSLQSILNFSRHADLDMLMRYLNWGSVSTAHCGEMMDVMKTSLTSLNFDPPPMTHPTTKTMNAQLGC